jgi:aspartyl/glutamyl-tRNA(Asn/Gln) amidotransferase C subunit
MSSTPPDSVGSTDEEIDSLTSELDHILEAMRALQQLDTSAISPTAQVIPLHNVMREDITWECCPWTKFCKTRPRRATAGSWYRRFPREL